MASQRGSNSSFSSAAFNQNFPSNNFNVNAGMDRPSRLQFQRPPNPPSGSFQSVEKTEHGFQNRPQFSNFSNAPNFVNRPPPLQPPTIHPPSHPPPSTIHPSPFPACNTFPVPSNSPLKQFAGPAISTSQASFSSQSHSSFSASHSVPPRVPYSTPVPSQPPPNFSSQPAFSSQQLPPQHNQLPNMSCPPQHNRFPIMSPPPQPNQLSNMSCLPRPDQLQNMPRPPQHNQPPNMLRLPQQNQPPNMSHFSQQNQPPNMSHFSQQNQPPNMPHPPQQNQPPNMPHPQQNQPPNMPHPPQRNRLQNMPCPPQHNQLPNVSPTLQYNQISNMPCPPQRNFSNISQSSQQNQYSPMSRPPRPHQGYRMQSPSSPRLRFDNPFQHSQRPWNQITRFDRPRTPFTNRSPNIDKSQQVNRKKKEKSREFRKLKSWMTDELFAEVKKKNALYLKAKSADEQTAWQEFRLQRNRVSSLIKEAKIKAGLITRKVKEEDFTEKPYSCDTCDRAFVTEDELRDHKSQHITCHYENCTFEAHPKVVLIHQKMQHETGYAERINKLKDDEEIKKWREERRKRFPTAENIRRRKAEQAEKLARGEVLETKDFGKFKRKREENGELECNNKKRKRIHRGKRNHYRTEFPEHPGFRDFTVNSESDSDSDSHITLNRFSGLSSLANSDEEFAKEQADKIIKKNSSEQNLPKIISNVNENHLNVSFSENNLTNGNAESTVIVNAEKLMDSDEEGPDVTVINKCQEEIYIAENSDETPEIVAINHKDGCDNEGTASVADESVIEIPEDEVEKPKKELIVVEDSDDEAPEVVAISKCQEEICIIDKEEETTTDNNAIVKVSRENQREVSNEKMLNGTSVDNAPKVFQKNHENANKRGNQSRNQRGRKENSSANNHCTTSHMRKSSLLEKLMADDIRHERNVILQCIRHIVNNNFFGLAVKKS